MSARSSALPQRRRGGSSCAERCSHHPACLLLLISSATAGELPGNGAGSAWGCPSAAPLPSRQEPGQRPEGGSAGCQGYGISSQPRGQKITRPKDKAPVSLAPLLGKLCHLLTDRQIFRFPEPSVPTGKKHNSLQGIRESQKLKKGLSWKGQNGLGSQRP